MPRTLFYYTGLERIVRAINIANNLSLTVNNCVISKPSPVAGSWKEITTNKNTVIKVSQTIPANTYNGKNWCVYDRVTLSSFLNLFPNPNDLQVDYPKSTKDLIRAVNRRTGMGLEDKDIVDNPITLDGDGKAQVALIAHPESLMWIGSHTFNIRPGDMMLTENVTVTTMDGFKYPDGTIDFVSGYGYAQPYSYSFDFTLKSDELHAAVVGTDVSALPDILTYITKTTWTNAAADADKSFTVFGAEITYNGLNTANLPTNSAFKYVMVVKMGAKSILKGNLYLQYNDKDDPNSPN